MGRVTYRFPAASPSNQLPKAEAAQAVSAFPFSCVSCCRFLWKPKEDRLLVLIFQLQAVQPVAPLTHPSAITESHAWFAPSTLSPPTRPLRIGGCCPGPNQPHRRSRRA